MKHVASIYRNTYICKKCANKQKKVGNNVWQLSRQSSDILTTKMLSNL